MYKHFRLDERNILLGTVDEHTKQTNDPGSCKADPVWDGFFSRFAALFNEYEQSRKENKFKFKQ